MTNPAPQARVGVGVFVYKPDLEHFLIGLRKGSHGAGSWALPGGHLDFGELSFAATARREVLEETGLVLSLAATFVDGGEGTDKGVEFLTATNDVWDDAKKGMVHYVTVFVVARVEQESAEAKVLEPDKCERWEWVTWEELIEKEEELFMPLRSLTRQLIRVRRQPSDVLRATKS